MYQTSHFDVDIWIDEGDTADFVCSNVQDAVFMGDDVRVIPVRPQPDMRSAVFLDAPEWVVHALRVPVLIEVHSTNFCRYMEVFVGRVDVDCIRLALGQKWIVGGKVFIGEDTSPLQHGQLAQLFPGVLIRVLPSHITARPCLTLDRKVAAPRRWFDVEEPQPCVEVDPPRHIGLVGVMGDWATIPARRVHTVSGLQEEVEQACGCLERDFYVIAPERHSANLYFRGDRVVSTLAVVPRAAASCCTVFLDARDLTIPLTALFLPLATTNLTHVLRLAGGDRPVGLRLCVSGASMYDPFTEQIMPHHRALIHVSVDRSCTWECQADLSDRSASPASPGSGPSGNDTAGSQADGLHGPPRGLRMTDLDTASYSNGLMSHVQAELGIVQHLHIHNDVPQTVDRAAAPTPLDGVAPGPADFGIWQPVIEEGGESEPPVPSSPRRPSDWRMPVRILTYQVQDSFRTLFVAAGESVADVHVRAAILLSPAGLAHEVLISDPQPCSSWLTVMLVPSWWRAVGLHAVLVTERNAVERDHVALCHGGVLTTSLLPDALDEASRRVEVYRSGSLLEVGDDIDAGTILFLQSPGQPAPRLPTAQEIIQDYTVECEDSQLPVPETIPPLRYLLLDDSSGQTLIELQHGPVSPQVAQAVSCTAADVRVWFQKGPSGVFGNISVQGRAVQKCLGNRVVPNAPDQPHHMVFIDARQLGVPICCRLFHQTVFRAEDFVEAVQARVPGGFEARCAGGQPFAEDPLVRRVEHCGSVTLWVEWTRPVPPPPVFSEESDPDDLTDSEGG